MTITRKFLLALFVLAALLSVSCAREETKPAATAPTTAPAAPAVDMASAATITGKVLYKDGKPTLARLRMDADAACSRLHSEPVYSRELVVNDNGTLRWVFVYVKEGPGNQSFPAPKQAVVLDQKGCMYEPHVIGLVVGQELNVTNSDQTTHNIHPVPTTNREWNKSQPPGSDKLVESFAREEETIPVKCNIHPWMRSYIHVLKHPFFATTGADGSFEIKGLPPGDYTIVAWQEKLGKLEQKVTVGPKESKAVEFTFTPKAGGD